MSVFKIQVDRGDEMSVCVDMCLKKPTRKLIRYITSANREKP
jgi:hypothetical protein